MIHLTPIENSPYLGIVRIVTSNLLSRKRFIRFFPWALDGVFFFFFYFNNVGLKLYRYPKYHELANDLQKWQIAGKHIELILYGLLPAAWLVWCWSRGRQDGWL